MVVPLCSPSGSSSPYRRRQPEQTELYRAVRDHMASFLAAVEDEDGDVTLPAHMRAELERYLRCGLLSHGFVRVWCSTCKEDLLVGFSCKGRGVCPSCAGRRMADTAARWVDHVLPDVCWRQWVLTVPFELRLWMAWDPELTTDVLTELQRAIANRLRLLARRKGHRGGRHASVTVIQRFGSALNLNVHFHALVSEGVWVEGAEGDGPPVYVPLKLTTKDVQAVLQRVERRVLRILVERDLLDLDDEQGNGICAPDAEPDEQLQLALMQASIGLRIASGPRAGERVRRVGARHEPREPADTRIQKRMHAAGGGFDLHAGVFVARADREKLERVARYLLRPALALDRIRLVDGEYEVGLKRPWSDGTHALRFSPHELMEKLSVLVPMPRANLVRYNGVLAPAAKWRDHVFPRPDWEGRVCGQRPPGGRVPKRRVPWAMLIRRVFLDDFLRCPTCKGARRLIGEVTDPDAIAAILEHLGIDEDAEGQVPVRGPPQSRLPW